MAFAPDGRTVLTGEYGGFLRLWDVETGELRESWRGDSKRVDQVIYSPDGATIASVGQDPAVKLWDAQSHVLRRSLAEPNSHHFQMAYAPGGATLAVSSKEGIKLWDPKTGVVKDHLRAGSESCPALASTPDGENLVAGGLAISWLCSLKPAVGEDDRCIELLRFPDRRSDCPSVAVSPDGRWVAHCLNNFGHQTKVNFKLVAIR